MCGIIGYIGSRQAAPVLLKGLKRLEYRGYDSSGIAVVSEKNGCCGIDMIKTEGKIDRLVEKTDGGKKLSGTVGIGHTRWATHGVPNDVNAHPHLSSDGRFAIVHNGIIENFVELKRELEARGYAFSSETDSEVIAALLQTLYDGDMARTLRAIDAKLSGSYAIGVICSDSPAELYALKKDSPLVIGLCDGETFIASDVAAALEYTHEFILLDDRELAVVTPSGAKVYDESGAAITKAPYTVDWDVKQAEKGGYPHFMLKEVFAQPKALTDTVRPRIKNGEILLDGIEFDSAYVESLSGIDIVGCGSAYHAGIVGKYFIEKHCRLRVNCVLASEYIYSDPITDGKRLTIIISQSGETADTLSALRLAKRLGSRTIAIVNVVQSAIAREADDVLYTHAGPEISVCTTKGYTTQVAALYLVGLKLATIRHTITHERYLQLLDEITALSDRVREQLAPEYVDAIKRQAEKYYEHKCVFFIGRGTDYAASLEGALKLKEISYIHAEAYAAGELKHGTISLIEDDTITLALVTQSALYPKMENNIKSVKSRDGKVLAIASERNAAIEEHTDGIILIPVCDDDVAPVLAAVVLQLFAYYVASLRGCDIDKPRHLAKSVTVE